MAMDPQCPTVSEAARQAMAADRARLVEECG